MLVRDLMHADPVTVRPGTTVLEALRMLDRHHVTAMPVVDGEGAIRGIVSEADLIGERVPADPRVGGEATEDEGARPRLVKDVMTRLPMVVTPDTDVALVAELTTSTGVKSLPVLEGREVVGMVSRSDIVHALATADDELEHKVCAVLCSAGLEDWLVEVRAGVVRITGPDTAAEAGTARALARTVPGVVDVRLELPGRRRR
jgi:CBS domain-containing protein